MFNFQRRRHLKLTAEQKCDIAQRELEELRDEIEKLKDESEKILDNFRVSQEVCEKFHCSINSVYKNGYCWDLMQYLHSRPY